MVSELSGGAVRVKQCIRPVTDSGSKTGALMIELLDHRDERSQTGACSDHDDPLRVLDKLVERKAADDAVDIVHMLVFATRHPQQHSTSVGPAHHPPPPAQHRTRGTRARLSPTVRMRPYTNASPVRSAVAHSRRAGARTPDDRPRRHQPSGSAWHHPGQARCTDQPCTPETACLSLGRPETSSALVRGRACR